MMRYPIARLCRIALLAGAALVLATGLWTPRSERLAQGPGDIILTKPA